MIKNWLSYIRWCLLLILVILIGKAVTSSHGRKQELILQEDLFFDYEKIKLRGYIKVVTHSNHTDHYIYRGRPLGFQLSLLSNFADNQAIGIDINSLSSIEDPINDLLSGKADIIASSQIYSDTTTIDKVEIIPINEVYQVMVTKNTNESFDDATIYVQHNSSFIPILEQLSNTVNVSKLEYYNPIQWHEALLNGETDYIVCDENDAIVLVSKNPDLKIVEKIGFKGDFKAWLIRKNSSHLSALIHVWLSRYKKSSKYKALCLKYFSKENLWFRATSSHFAMNSGKISQYDEIAKKYGHEMGVDWKLVVALMYNESKFDSTAVSTHGAYGLMQMLPSTLNDYGLDTTANVEQQIYAATRYLKELNILFEKSVPNTEERVKFVMAAYNSGPGHIFDAQRIASSQGKQPDIWYGNVDQALLVKSSLSSEYDKDLVRHGYAKGKETYLYVRNLMLCYDSYKGVITD